MRHAYAGDSSRSKHLHHPYSTVLQFLRVAVYTACCCWHHLQIDSVIMHTIDMGV
jgi:hypothetical protein